MGEIATLSAVPISSDGAFGCEDASSDLADYADANRRGLWLSFSYFAFDDGAFIAAKHQRWRPSAKAVQSADAFSRARPSR